MQPGVDSMRFFAISTAILAMTPSAVAAQMVTAQNPQSVAKVLQDAGYKAQMSKDNGGDPMITSGHSGKTFVVLFFGCEKNVKCTSIQFYTGYTGTKADPAKVNAWNDERRFGRGSIDKDGDLVVRMDVDLDMGGMSAALFKDHVDIWAVVMDKFAAQVVSN